MAPLQPQLIGPRNRGWSAVARSQACAASRVQHHTHRWNSEMSDYWQGRVRHCFEWENKNVRAISKVNPKWQAVEATSVQIRPSVLATKDSARRM